MDWIPFFVSIYHQQVDVYSGEIKAMPNPKYNQTNFDGIILRLQLNFTEPKSLSKNLLKTKD
jgi:hypothetical protein